MFQFYKTFQFRKTFRIICYNEQKTVLHFHQKFLQMQNNVMEVLLTKKILMAIVYCEKAEKLLVQTQFNISNNIHIIIKKTIVTQFYV